MTAPVVVWFRQDLRLTDNPALFAATHRDAPIVCLYVLDQETPGKWAMGRASLWWLHHSLAALEASLAARGGRLVLRRGAAVEIVHEVVRETGAQAVFWNRTFEPNPTARDEKIAKALEADGVAVEIGNAALLVEPWSVRTQGDTPFKVYTPFWKAARAQISESVIHRAPGEITPYKGRLASDKLTDWGLLPRKPNWAHEFPEHWTPGEDGAKAALGLFMDEALKNYARGRDRPAEIGSSRLSPHLHFGEIGPRQVWRALHDLAAREPRHESMVDKYLSELGWREFAYHLLDQDPALPDLCFRREYANFPWENDARALKAWQRGATGIPIVDAGMRQLWRSGWMHNRVRMITASLLVKHLLVPWQKGAAWFWDTLVDADLANNSMNWQWVAGCGADAAPYFRIFNPVLQGEKFDPDGDYVREWVPELAKMPAKFIHRPWEANADTLQRAGVTLGKTYPEPIVSLDAGRKRALAAFASLRSAA